MTTTTRTTRPRRRRRTALAALAATAALTTGLALGAPADADRSFGRDGRVTVDSGRYDTARAAAVGPDGGIVVAGEAGGDVSAYRLRPDGSPDRGFGGTGFRIIPTADRADGARAVAIQPDGKILLAGESTKAGTDGVIHRLEPAGGLDQGFGAAGTVDAIDSVGDADLYAVAVGPDGRIVAAGATTAFSAAAVYRLTPGGKPDDGFGTNGGRGLEIGGIDYATSVAVQPDGRIVIAGVTAGGGTSRAFAARFTRNGEDDRTFGGGDGLTLIDSATSAEAIALQPDGKILIAGTTGGDIWAGRLTAAGLPDQGFGTGGSVRLDGGNVDEGGSSMAVQPDGKILVAGYTYPSDRRALVFRLRPDGSPDPSFGEGGLLATGADGAQENPWALALQGDGKIVMAGSTETTNDVLVQRFQGDRPGGAPSGGPAGGPSNPGATAKVRCAGRVATIVGTRRADHIRGTARADVIAALGGNDVVRGLAGDDVVCGGPGDDRIAGGVGRDLLRGEAGRDRLIGGAGRDRLVGGAGRDIERR